ncbi:molybdate ABC transporter substrate-binding protein [Miniphocaeibacter massiliensis]|uniref:molybdate ABC transporter substrate-binding protein n=1 Tax=Miniphocaeibacter massiliensis TaxID=2041841 RepID=UPI000C08B73B|nr:molybdate ABC transporter substrate-binding protein [Miniphocaeibacter massiliensis]
MFKKKYLLIFSMLLALLLTFTACNKNTKETEVNKTEESKETVKLTVAAAASLTESFNEMKPLLLEKGLDIDFTYGASGTLQKQIEEGAGIDAFISASTKNMNKLVEGNFVKKNNVKTIVKNALVLIVPDDNKEIKNIEGLVEVKGKISIGEPEVVPAGQYAKEALINYGLWDKLNEKFVYGKDVKSVLSYVSTGEVDAGFVYKSDTTGVEKIKIVEEVNPSKYTEVIYPGAVIEESKEKDAAQSFIDYLSTDEAKQILEKYGFVVK